MNTKTITFDNPRPTDRTGNRVAECSAIPKMRPRTGKRGTDQELAKLLNEALESLAECNCTFWACNGPSRPQDMVTCTKCRAMRHIATVAASLKARDAALVRITEEAADAKVATEEWLRNQR